MTGRDDNRRCGNCGKPARDADTACPHCGALLAAYESPAGATTGTNPATTPVTGEHIPVPVPEAPPPPAAPADNAEGVASPTKPPTLNEGREAPVSAPSSPPDYESPIAESLKETRAAANLDDDDAPPPPSEQPVDLAEARKALGLAPEPEPLPDPGDQEDDAQKITVRSTSPKPRPHSVANQRAPRRPDNEVSPPPTDVGPETGSDQTTNTSGFSIQAVVGILVFLFIMSRIIDSGRGFSFLIGPIIMIGLFWLMAAFTRANGRKITMIPKDRDQRR